jgi:dolichol kinase
MDAEAGRSCWSGTGVRLVHKKNRWNTANTYPVELVTHAIVMVGALGLYPLRLLIFSWRNRTPSDLRSRQRIHIPATFDPAPLLYPAIMPVIISISLFGSYQKPLLANIILGLAALPPQIIPFGRLSSEYSTVHWLLSILPLFVAENTDIPSALSASRPYKLRLPPPDKGIDPESLVALFPLHQAMLPPLYYLTTTSLLPTELHLLSIGLINLLLLAMSPQTEILKTLMWFGGVGIFVLCGRILKWGVALARIPRWRFRRVGQVIRARQSFLQSLNDSIGLKQTPSAARKGASDSDTDGESCIRPVSQKTVSLMRVNTVHSARNNMRTIDSHEPQSALEAKDLSLKTITDNTLLSKSATRLRRNTLPALAAEDHTSKHQYSNRKRSKSIAQSYLSLTPAQAQARKWVYAAYFYFAVVAIILGPIRYIISKYALHDQEPFGWAIGYLFGDMQKVRWEVFRWNLDWWIPLPPMQDYDDLLQVSKILAPAEKIRIVLLGQANTRLLLCMYCVGTIVVGLLSVFSLSSVVEVDTRRKVFHGTMVAMLLPTIYIDPCFVALALSLVLAIFLLLDLIRASQLPPLSRYIANFLTPYVDGRDLRGPVVVSHIFLLIGCAIPLWLSLAGIERAGSDSWQGWEVQTRDVSMVAGVVCVGMGDAAASLIGRRYGRRKWPWAGGKSLEGSLAFAVAVIVGLVFGKVWLHIGWEKVQMQRTAAICAVGASLNEAVLTGGNDNVIVPVVLWVLIRGVRL